MGETKDEIHERMLDNIGDAYDKTEGSWAYDFTRPTAIELEDVDKSIDEAKDKLSIENLQGDELAQRIREKTGIIRKPATKANDSVTITGAPGSTLYVGDLVASDLVNFVIQEEITIEASGQVTVLVECEQEGNIGNVPAGAIKYFPVTLAGITSVTNPEAFTNGYEAESDADLLQRYYERIQTPTTSGNRQHYLNWAKEVIGVGDAKVFPLWSGDNTVKVVIIDSNKQPAGQELVDDVQNYIDPGITGLGDGEAPIGAFCTVVSAAGKIISVSFTGVLAPGYTPETAAPLVEAKLIEYYKEIAFKKDEITGNPKSVSYAIIGSKILETEAVIDYTDLLVNDGTANIPIGDEEVPVSGGVVIA